MAATGARSRVLRGAVTWCRAFQRVADFEEDPHRVHALAAPARAPRAHDCNREGTEALVIEPSGLFWRTAGFPPAVAAAHALPITPSLQDVVHVAPLPGEARQRGPVKSGLGRVRVAAEAAGREGRKVHGRGRPGAQGVEQGEQGLVHGGRRGAWRHCYRSGGSGSEEGIPELPEGVGRTPGGAHGGSDLGRRLRCSGAIRDKSLDGVVKGLAGLVPGSSRIVVMGRPPVWIS